MFGRSLRQRMDAFDMFRRVLDAAAELGAQYYVYHGRNTAQLSPLPFNLQANIDVMGQMSGEAAQRNIQIAWENVFWCQLTTIERISEVIAALPDVRFTLDIKQAMRAGENPLDMARAMGESLVNVHICDWKDSGKLCLPGEGCFQFDELMRALDGIGYAGPVVLEPYLALIDSDEALKRSISHVRGLMDKVRL